MVPGFVVQGGDPTGTGKGGVSIFGKNFKDEFHPALEHRGAGILRCAGRTMGVRTLAARLAPGWGRSPRVSIAGPLLMPC